MTRSTIRAWAYTVESPETCLLPCPYEIGHDVIPDRDCPEIVHISDQPQNHWLYYFLRMAHARIRYGWKPVLYCADGENRDVPPGFDFTFSHNPSTATNCLRFYVLGSPGFSQLLTNQHDGQMREWREVKKTRFCNFIYTDDWRPWTRVRQDFCKLLAEYKPVACPARSLNNMPLIPRYGREAKLDFMAGCKFTIAFENSSSDYYLTEKIFDAFRVGSVPIYWGCPRVAEYFNPAAFVNCHDYGSFEEVVARVREIDGDPVLYRQYLDAPPVLPGSRFHEMIEENRRYVDRIVAAALERRGRKKSRLRDMVCLVRLSWQCLPSLPGHTVYTLAKLSGLKGKLRVGRKLYRLLGIRGRS